MPPRGVGFAVAVAAGRRRLEPGLPADAAAGRALLARGTGRTFAVDVVADVRPVPGPAAAGRARASWPPRWAGCRRSRRSPSSRCSSSCARGRCRGGDAWPCAPPSWPGPPRRPGSRSSDGLFAGGGGWMVVEAVLARLLWVLLQRAGREADRLMQRAVRRRARRRDRRCPPLRPARALGDRARHLGEHAADDRSGRGARHRGVAARPGAARHRAARTGRATGRRRRTPPRSRWNAALRRGGRRARACASRSTARRG